MSFKAILVLASFGAALLVGSGAARTSATFYWPSYEANIAIEASDWGDARNVDTAYCRGVGDYRRQGSLYLFRRFRCDLKNPNYDRIGFVTIYTTGPESWKPANFIRPRC